MKKSKICYDKLCIENPKAKEQKLFSYLLLAAGIVGTTLAIINQVNRNNKNLAVS